MTINYFTKYINEKKFNKYDDFILKGLENDMRNKILKEIEHVQKQ